MSVDETVAAIDAAVGCQQCGRPLRGSVSADFDTEECQAAWHAARAARLVDDEPEPMTPHEAALEVGWAVMREALTTYTRDPNAAAYAEFLRTREALKAQYRIEERSRMDDAPDAAFTSDGGPVHGEPAGVFVGPDSIAWQLRVAAPLLDEFMTRAADGQLRVQQRRERGVVR